MAYTGTHDPRRRGRGEPPDAPMARAGGEEVSAADGRPTRPASAGAVAAGAACPPGGAGAATLRAVKVVWQREMIRLRRRPRPASSSALVQPLLFLFVLGTGLSAVVERRHRRRRLPHVPVPGRAGDVDAVHGGVRRRVDRVGPGVRLPARDAGRAGAAHVVDPAGQVPRRRDRRDRCRACSCWRWRRLVGVPYAPALMRRADRAAVPGCVHDHGVRPGAVRADQEHPGGHAADAAGASRR